MTKARFKALRKAMRYSLSDLSQLIGIAKSTLQRYEDGSANVPEDVAAKMEFELKRDKAWKKQMLKRINADLDRQFPDGIISEAYHE